MSYYTGVGSRTIPSEIGELIRRIGHKMAELGHVLRSGGADGADTAFACGAGWPLKWHMTKIYRPHHATPEAMELAKSFHPAWHLLKSDYVRQLHARNALQVLGDDLKTPSFMLICWTQDGCISHEERSIQTGGTGTAISIASKFGVPVRNLQRPDHLQKALDWLKS